MAAEPDLRPDRPGRAPDRDRHAAPDARARARPPEPGQAGAPRPSRTDIRECRVDDAGEAETRGREQRGVLLLGALAAARHHEHVEVGERRLDLEARPAQDASRRPGRRRPGAGSRAGRAGSRRTGRRASRGGSTSAGSRRPRAPPRRSCRSPPPARDASAGRPGLGGHHVGLVEDRAGQVRMALEHGLEQEALSPADVDDAWTARRSRRPPPRLGDHARSGRSCSG